MAESPACKTVATLAPSLKLQTRPEECSGCVCSNFVNFEIKNIERAESYLELPVSWH
jgi:hypothetical protein